LSSCCCLESSISTSLGGGEPGVRRCLSRSSSSVMHCLRASFALTRTERRKGSVTISSAVILGDSSDGGCRLSDMAWIGVGGSAMAALGKVAFR